MRPTAYPDIPGLRFGGSLWPAVRVRIGDEAYELRAEEVRDAKCQWIASAYAEKHGEDRDAIFGRPSTVDDFELVYPLSQR